MSKDEKFTRAASQRERAACLDLPCVDHARGFACDDPELFARLQATIDNEPAPSTGLRGPRWGRGPAAKASRQLTEWFADWARRARRALTNLESVGPIEREAYVAAYTALRAAITRLIGW